MALALLTCSLRLQGQKPCSHAIFRLCVRCSEHKLRSRLRGAELESHPRRNLSITLGRPFAGHHDAYRKQRSGPAYNISSTGNLGVSCSIPLLLVAVNDIENTQQVHVSGLDDLRYVVGLVFEKPLSCFFAKKSFLNHVSQQFLWL
jgi:hypothetical protein